jgi:hypothetical protein
MLVNTAPSFISAAYLYETDEVQMWVLGVNGLIFSVTHEKNEKKNGNVTITQVTYDTDLELQHFVKVDNLFYYFRVSNLGASVEQSILTYLPHYESLRTSTTVHLQAVYSVVVIPSKRLY